ncbi:MAG: AMP-binding protein [Candidatus Peribacteria bacterium]|nr:AMP-binding protein [Candidatus Peribacteria bacterium]
MKSLFCRDTLIFSDKHIFDNVNVDRNNISFFYFSGGTTGSPKVIPLSKNELNNKAKYRAKCYQQIGITNSNRVAILLPFGPWVAGPSSFEAVREIGCTVFPMGLLKDETEVVYLFSIIKKHKIDTIITTPSFMDFFIKILEKNRIELKLKFVITSGEFLPVFLREKIKKMTKAKAFSSYACSETFIGCECCEHNGFHYDPNNVKIKVFNKKLYITVYDSETILLLNYKLGDVGFIKNECKCGLPLPKVILTGRDKNIFVLSGAVNVYPYQIVEFIKSNNIDTSECLIEIFDKDSEKIKFNFGFKTKKSKNKINIKNLTKLIKDLSLDFADIYEQGLIKIEVKTFISSHAGNKLKITVNDKRKYEK